MKTLRRSFALFSVALAIAAQSNFAQAATPSPGVPCSARDSAVIANTGQVFSDSNSLVDSYQSSLGPYGGTNVGSDGNVQAATTIVPNGGVIHGAETQSDPANLPLVPPPAGATNLPLGSASPGNLNINNASQSLTLAPGNYVVANVNVNFPGAINVSPAGRVQIWVTGNLSLGGNEDANGIPDNLEFLVTSSSSVNINGSGRLFGFVYAPASPVNVNSTIFGGVVGSTVSLNSGSAVHFDQSSTCDQAIAVSTGNFFACALTERGGVKCWGINSSGVLGDGMTNVMEPMSPVPAQVVGLTSGATAITVANGVSACAVTTGGAVSCWGQIEAIFNNPPADATAPVPVTGFSSPVSTVSIGQNFACAIGAGGGVSCWGSAPSYAFGNGGTTDPTSFIVTPTPVAALDGLAVTDISVGFDFDLCAVTTGGGLVCWGDNTNGELGNGTSGGASSVAVPVPGLTSGVVAVSVGLGDTCALTAAGGVVCWGNNDFGQLGNGTTTSSLVPVPVTGLSSGVAAVSVGGRSACALTTGGGVLCWGSNFNGELGDGTTMSSPVPVPVTGLSSGVVAVAVGEDDPTCAVTEAGAILCWGDDVSGELGNGLESSTPSLVPGPVVGFP